MFTAACLILCLWTCSGPDGTPPESPAAPSWIILDTAPNTAPKPAPGLKFPAARPCPCTHSGCACIPGQTCRAAADGACIPDSLDRPMPPPVAPAAWLEVANPAGWELWGRRGADGRVYPDGPERWRPVAGWYAAPAYMVPARPRRVGGPCCRR